MNRTKSLILLCALALLLAGSCDSLKGLTAEEKASRYVDKLMTEFRNGTMEGIHCPDVQWVHIPALLEYAKSTEVIGHDITSGESSMMTIPTNPLSSYMMTQCLEGTFALWMVEAARQHSLPASARRKDYFGWPSLNPIILSQDGSTSSTSWSVCDVETHQAVLAAYLKWWEQAGGDQSAASINPLEGTGYRWQ